MSNELSVLVRDYTYWLIIACWVGIANILASGWAAVAAVAVGTVMIVMMDIRWSKRGAQ